jgi:hypothetical protein
MNSFFVTQDEKNNIDELWEDDFLDINYQDRELPEDFFKELFVYKTQDDTDLIVPKERKRLGDLELSTVGSIENVEHCPTIMYGSKYVQQAQYEIRPDYEPAVIVMQYFFEYMINPNVTFPYVPVAQPSVPFSAQEQTITFVDIEIVMDQAGALIYDPSYPYQDKRDNSYYVHATNQENEREQFELKMEEKKFIFSSRSYFKDWVVNDYRVACYEFNPMHPMAAPYIRDYKDNGRVISGHYKWGRRMKSFLFDRYDKRYRIHSEVWYTIFGSRQYYMAMFDIVSNFDLIKLLPQIAICAAKTIYNIYPERIIEGYSVYDYTKSPYSFMMKERDENQIEEEQYIVPYYSNIPIQVKRRGTKFYDVTHLYDLRYHNGSKYELMVVNRRSGELVCRIMKGENHRNYRGDDRYFVYFSLRCKAFKVYTSIKMKGEVEKKFILCEGCYFIGVPRNEIGSLIIDPSIVSFQEYVQRAKMLSEEAEVVVRSMPVSAESDIEMQYEVKKGLNYSEGFFDEQDKDKNKPLGDDDEDKYIYNDEYFEED